MSPTVFDPVISASVRPQTHDLDRAAMEWASLTIYAIKLMLKYKICIKILYIVCRDTKDIIQSFILSALEPSVDKKVTQSDVLYSSNLMCINTREIC